MKEWVGFSTFSVHTISDVDNLVFIIYLLEKVKNEANRIVTSSPDPEDQDPEQIGFIKVGWILK